VSNFACNVLAGTAQLRVTVLAGMRGDALKDTVKLRWAVPPE